MKVYVLPKKCNDGIRKILELEYIRSRTELFLHAISVTDEKPPTILSNVYYYASMNLVDVVNTIIMDSLISILRTNNVNLILTCSSNSKLNSLLKADYHHANKLLNFQLTELLDPDYQLRLLGELNRYITHIYRNNVEEFNVNVFNLLSELKGIRLGEGLPRSEIVKDGVPVVLVH